MFLGVFAHVETHEFYAQLFGEHLAELCLAHACRAYEEEGGYGLVGVGQSCLGHHDCTGHLVHGLILSVNVLAYVVG